MPRFGRLARASAPLLMHFQYKIFIGGSRGLRAHDLPHLQPGSTVSATPHRALALRPRAGAVVPVATVRRFRPSTHKSTLVGSARRLLLRVGILCRSKSSERQQRRIAAVGDESALPPIVFSNSGSGCQALTIILAGPTVLSAVGACPPHDGVRRRWRINVASAVALFERTQKIGRSHHRHRPGRDDFSRCVAGTLGSPYARYAATFLVDQLNSVGVKLSRSSLPGPLFSPR